MWIFQVILSSISANGRTLLRIESKVDALSTKLDADNAAINAKLDQIIEAMKTPPNTDVAEFAPTMDTIEKQ